MPKLVAKVDVRNASQTIRTGKQTGSTPSAIRVIVPVATFVKWLNTSTRMLPRCVAEGRLLMDIKVQELESLKVIQYSADHQVEFRAYEIEAFERGEEWATRVLTMIEFDLNYATHCQRHLLQCISQKSGSDDLHLDMIKKLEESVRANCVKSYSDILHKTSAAPPLPADWHLNVEWDLPIVLWIKSASKRGDAQKRNAPRPGSASSSGQHWGQQQPWGQQPAWSAWPWQARA